jgi:hypothetical protein
MSDLSPLCTVDTRPSLSKKLIETVANEERLRFNDELRRHFAVFYDLKGGRAMKCRKQFTLCAVLLSLLSLVVSMGTLKARDADLSSLTFAAARTAKQQCRNICRARYRDCVSLRQIYSFECREVYHDCIRFTCNAVRG